MPRVRTHPGEGCARNIFVPLGMSARALATALGVPPNRVTEIMRGERDVTANTAHPARPFFDNPPPFLLHPPPPHDPAQAAHPHDYSKPPRGARPPVGDGALGGGLGGVAILIP